MERYLTAREIGEILKIGQVSVYALLKRPGFPVTRVGKRKYVSESALTKWLESGGTGNDSSLIKR